MHSYKLASLQIGRCLRLCAWILLMVLFLTYAGCRQKDTRPIGNVASDAVRIQVKQDGFHKVTLAELKDTGLSLDKLHVDDLFLSQGGIPVPYLIDDESLIFYGDDSNVFLLKFFQFSFR